VELTLTETDALDPALAVPLAGETDSHVPPDKTVAEALKVSEPEPLFSSETD
jgi:hypothetical protein